MYTYLGGSHHHNLGEYAGVRGEHKLNDTFIRWGLPVPTIWLKCIGLKVFIGNSKVTSHATLVDLISKYRINLFRSFSYLKSRGQHGGREREHVEFSVLRYMLGSNHQLSIILLLSLTFRPTHLIFKATGKSFCDDSYFFPYLTKLAN